MFFKVEMLNQTFTFFYLFHIKVCSSITMRQVSSKPRKSESDHSENVNPNAQEVKEFGEKEKETNLVSGAKTGESEAFSKADAVKAFHEKPQPTHEKPVNQKPNVIQQPRKC